MNLSPERLQEIVVILRYLRDLSGAEVDQALYQDLVGLVEERLRPRPAGWWWYRAENRAIAALGGAVALHDCGGLQDGPACAIYNVCAQSFVCPRCGSTARPPTWPPDHDHSVLLAEVALRGDECEP